MNNISLIILASGFSRRFVSNKLLYEFHGKKLIEYAFDKASAFLDVIVVTQYEKIKEMALEAALVVPQVRYVGWDIAVSENGPCLIEGNEYPGHVFYVFAEHHPDHKGCRHIFESVMD